MRLRWFYKAIVTQTSTWPELIILIDSNKILHPTQIPRVNILWSYLTWYQVKGPFAKDLQSRKILSISTRNISRFVKHFHLIKVDRRLLTRFYSFSFIICISSKHTVKNTTFITRTFARILFAIAFSHSQWMNICRLNSENFHF